MIRTMHEVNLYSRIDGSGYRNIWVVGDLHGCYTRLMSELHRATLSIAVLKMSNVWNYCRCPGSGQ